MKIATFAPHLAGRMLPGIFSQFVGKQERFPGDPWPYMHVLPSWYWMHTTGCTRDERGCLYGLYRGRRIPFALLAPESAAFNPPRRPAPPLPVVKRPAAAPRAKADRQGALFPKVR
jgi:hypothetical protein